MSVIDTSEQADTELNDDQPIVSEQGSALVDRWDIESARNWVKDHETLALVGSFAIGVLFGTLMRR